MGLFEQYETLPKEVNEIIADFDLNLLTYKQCRKFVKKLNTVGYTCEFGLDAIPFNLKKL